MSQSSYPALEGAPYFNFERRHLMIEGSYQVIPARPIEVGHVRQLLMDNHLVDSSWNCFRKVHEPQKHPDNPLIPPGDGYATGFEGCVLDDPQNNRIRAWGNVFHETRPSYDMKMVQVYYESEDGIAWTAPPLGIVEVEGSKANNIIQGANGFNYASVSVVEVPERLRSRGRYAMLYGCNDRKSVPGAAHGARHTDADHLER